MYLVVYLPSCQRNNPRTQLSDIYPYDIPSNLLFEKYNTPVANIPGLRHPRVQWPVWWLHGLPHTVNRPCGAVVTWCFMHGPPLRFYQGNALVKQACRPQNMFCRSVPCTRKQGHSTGPKEPHLQKSSVGLKRTWCRQPDSSTPSRWTSRSNPGMLKKMSVYILYLFFLLYGWPLSCWRFCQCDYVDFKYKTKGGKKTMLESWDIEVQDVRVVGCQYWGSFILENTRKSTLHMYVKSAT